MFRTNTFNDHLKESLDSFYKNLWYLERYSIYTFFICSKVVGL
jgi:hypothetical protein